MKQRTTSSERAPDLFGFKNRQGDLFANEPAESFPPWNERTTRLYQAIFPQMANWLPNAEAEQLRLEFHTELERLSLAHKS